MSTEVLYSKEIFAPEGFDTYKDKRLKVRLTRHSIPYKGHTLFSGMMMYGDNVWSAEFFSQDGEYKHEGGWCWHENNCAIWKDRVNEDLHKKRIEADTSLVLRDSEWKSNKDILAKMPAKDKHYFLMPNGEKAMIGDIIKVAFSYEGYCRMEDHESYHVLYWNFGTDGRGWRYRFDISPKADYGIDNYKHQIYLDYAIRHGVKVEAKDGYKYLGQWGRKFWREIHGVKGVPKFK